MGYFCQCNLDSEDISGQLVSISSDVSLNFFADYDPNSWLISNKFQPDISGYYMVTLQTCFSDGSGNGQNNCQINKNGTTQLAIFQSPMPTNPGVGVSIGGSKLIYLDGNTDYLIFTAYSNSTIDQYVKPGNGTYFTAVFVSN